MMFCSWIVDYGLIEVPEEQAHRLAHTMRGEITWERNRPRRAGPGESVCLDYDALLRGEENCRTEYCEIRYGQHADYSEDYHVSPQFGKVEPGDSLPGSGRTTQRSRSKLPPTSPPPLRVP